jgi:hypothetical protein
LPLGNGLLPVLLKLVETLNSTRPPVAFLERRLPPVPMLFIIRL